jgi:hypothetical protein
MGSCPLCAHCQAKARTTTIDRDALRELQSVVANAGPYEASGYGTDGRSTAVVDWYHGWSQAVRVDAPEEPPVPTRIIDKVQWLLGWNEGRKDRRHYPVAAQFDGTPDE